ncbi:MAG: D-ornithine 4,5-aminomutase subunit OraS [Anaerolineaceae bacterium]
MTEERLEKFSERQERLHSLSDEALKARFWELCDQVVSPIAELARTHTSPSIERSVLLRMGIDSQSALGVVEKIKQAGLLGKGAGHVLLELAEKEHLEVKQAATRILEDGTVLQGLFGEVKP